MTSTSSDTRMLYDQIALVEPCRSPFSGPVEMSGAPRELVLTIR
ncbi:hypothetical protein [Allokutzneria sp. NRRL B-24872]|nr:hypothetical protein [Allokutzneria sp. NRRL B-24872]